MSNSEQGPPPTGSRVSRRTALKVLGGGAWAGAFAYALWPLREYAATIDLDSFLQKHYHELSPEEKEKVFRRLEAETKQDYGATVSIRDPQPQPGVKFGYALNLTVCIGCRQCVAACRRENNHDRRLQGSYIKVFEIEHKGMDLTKGTSAYEHPVPVDGRRYMPVQCHQCDRPPCVNVCPTKATWKEPDGIVVVDYNWCIGCRYCAAACPYHARFFNWSKPQIPAAEVNPDQSYLSNRIRPLGAMEKCTFCLHRTREGRLPACLEACPAGARVFGNLLDPASEIRWVLANRRLFILKEELGTAPSFYFFLAE
jgi:molybdopterin-containing oxidoreductase family iron-sulfur binding subunit